MQDILQLLELNRKGLIPGPGETEEQFFKRCSYCLNLKDNLDQEIKGLFNGSMEEHSKILESSCASLSKLSDIDPSWTLLFFSNYKLAPWHGGCAWIFQLTEESPTGAFMQLRKAFQHSPLYLKIYQREELLKHELVHVSRMAFQEPKYEEFLAYHTSGSAFRRWFGPIIRSSKESLLLVVVLALILVFDFFLIAMQRPEAFQATLWLKLIFLLLFVFALGRLCFGHYRLKRCLQNLKKCIVDPEKAWAVFYRLQDSEIDAFACMSPQQIKEYSFLQKEKELRWKVILEAYF